MDAELYQAIQSGEIESALRQTCLCLIREKWQPLQETWIRLLNIYGERMYHSQQTPLFYHLTKELTEILNQDDLPVKQALSFTTKLLLVFKRPFMTPRSRNKTTLQKLRTKVISYFPLDAQLTRSGKQKFQRFLPTDPEESAFAERIIVGLLQLCESSSPPEDLKDALEYLARKKLVLYTAPVLESVTSPSLTPPPPADEKEDLVSYIWMILKIIKPLSFDELLENMYYYDYRSSYKNMRLGFLYAMAYVTESSATSCEAVWNQTETVFLNRVYENSLELWKEAKLSDKDKKMMAAGRINNKDDGYGDGDEDVEDEITSGLSFLSFVPTAPVSTATSIPVRQVSEESRMTPLKKDKKSAKVIHISKGKGRNRLIQRQENFKLNTTVDIDAEDDEIENEHEEQRMTVRDGSGNRVKNIQTLAFSFIPKHSTEQKNVKDKEINKHKDSNGASHRDSSGNRRIHISKTRSGIQDPYGSEDTL